MTTSISSRGCPARGFRGRLPVLAPSGDAAGVGGSLAGLRQSLQRAFRVLGVAACIGLFAHSSPSAWADIPDQPGSQTSTIEIGGVTYVVHEYELPGAFTFTPPEDVTEVDLLIVAGGGGGGASRAFSNAGGGGGGAGGVVIQPAFPLLGSGTVPIVVGGGGSGAGTGNTSGANGGNSSFGGLIALGGGGGSGGNTAGDSGGSGGGSRGASGGAATQPGSAAGGLGNRGGNFPGSPAGAGASGGGGAGGAGGDADGAAGDVTDGGPGVSNDITGTPRVYAGGGGGGGAQNNPFGAGTDGGGNGANDSTAAQNGAPATGSGGGGGNNNRAGADGGSGVVIVRYVLPDGLADPDPDPVDPAEPPVDPEITSVSIAQAPLFLSAAVNPQVMLTMSNDHQLYFAAYDDFSDLSGNGLPDTTYVHDIEYYGYFDPYKCYTYNTTDDAFIPVAETANRYCTGQWSGNFLNWVSMARIDTVRKILYGGTRVVDTADRTIVERTHLPTDAHSWAKYYNGNDIAQLTPFSGLTTGESTQESGITFCNTTRPGTTVLSQDTTAPPLIRVARGNYALWASNERWQCKWREERSNLLGGFSLPDGTGQAGSNGNIPAISGILASPENPRRTGDDAVSLGSGLRDGEFVARVEVCLEGLVGTERCKRYPSGNLKPVGVLQLFGDEDLIDFGLMSGSYERNKSGGVLRKNVGTFRDEVNVDTDGTFRPMPATGGIVGTLDRFRMYGYRHRNNGTYFGVTGTDPCDFGRSVFDDGNCSNWGNPQSEIFLEALRYFGGHSPAPEFDADDSGRIAGLLTANWQDPLSDDNHCAPLNIIQFNASSSSYDGDQLARAVDIGLGDVVAATNLVGAGEGIHGNTWFVGEAGTDSNQLCTPKSVNALGDVAGTCPDAPRLEGSYNIAGLAHHAWTNSIRDDLLGEQFVRTLGVSLAPAVPQVLIPVPGSDRAVKLLPACRNTSVNPNGNCAIVDFKVVEQDFDAGTGRFYVNWEDIEQGGDYDSDVWGVITYEFEGSSVLRISTQVVATSTSQRLGFGYVLSGTEDGDGFRVHSGSQGFQFTDADGFPDCSDGCNVGDPATTAEYIVGAGATAALLEQPLYYAAKWGGFDKSEGDTDPTRTTELWDASGDGLPDNYFFAINPGELEQGLNDAFLQVLVTSASAASVATNSTRLDADAAIYQARFNSDKWSGELLAFSITPGGEVEELPLWNAADRLDAMNPNMRRIFSARDLDFADASDAGAVTTTGVEFDWDQIDETQRNALRQGLSGAELADGLDEERLLFLRGDRSLERTPGDQSQPFRARDSVLGDIVNSNPQFVGTQDFGYTALSDALGGNLYQAYRTANANRIPMVVVGANDGMLHAFDARVDAANLVNGGRELFAYVPAGVYANLHELTDPDYQHRYYVDGVPRVGDAWLGSTLGWRKVVAGTTGAGGRTVFLLDVTAGESMSATDVLWEFRHARLGVTIGQPSIVPLASEQFGVIVSSGYNNGTTGRLFMLDAATGAVIRELDTGRETAGMGTPLVLDTNGDAVADRVYVGDMEGRLWRFDIGSSDPNDWGIPSVFAGEPLFVARGPDGEVQPISAQPEGGRNRQGEIMVFFGTGTFFLNGDNVVPSDPDVQSFYGVIDRNAPVANRSNMTEQEILAEVNEFGRDLRVITDNELTPGNNGWYMDLLWKVDQGGEGPIGERVTQRAILRGGRIIFTTLIPSPNACDFGGDSWLIELNAFTGARIERPVFDLDGDGFFDEGDMVTVTLADGTVITVAPSGLKSESGILSQPTILSAGEREFKFLSGSTGEIETVTERASLEFGRQSWRELR